MVNRQHGLAGVLVGVAAIGIHVENVHAVVVVANAHAPFVSLGACVGIRWNAGHQAVARSMQHAVGVAGW